MTGLLVSVRSVREARAALRGGAHLIDVKEPALGSLGAATPHVRREIGREVAGQRPLSVALGELADSAAASSINEMESLDAWTDVNWAKAGLADCRRQSDWKVKWAALRAQLPDHTKLVAVAYADWNACGAPDPWQIMHVGRDIGCAALLIDTYHKDHRCLLHHLDPQQLDELVRAAREASMTSVLAGSLRPEHVRQIVAISPDFMAVRGAVCDGDRCASVCEHRVRALVVALSTI